MTVLDSRAGGSGEFRGKHTAGQSDALVTEAGVSMPPATDLGAGCGPEWLDEWLSEHGTDVLAWRRHIHSHPELSGAEYATTELIEGLLRSIGLRPWILPGETGVICDIGSGAQCVALRADIDALPLTEDTGLSFASGVDGVAHACGHDAHTTVLLATAFALARAPELPGRVRLIFQPAEEVMTGGALDVIDAGGLDGVDSIFGLHCDPGVPAGRVGTREGALTSAADLVELHLTSPGGHTSRPHLTADLVHALGSLITSLPGVLSRRVDPRSGTILVWGAVHAGEAANAVPQDGVLRGTLRTAEHTVWSELEPLVASAIDSLLAPSAVGYWLNYQRGVPPLINDPACTRLLRSGIESGLGEGALAAAGQSSGGEDFAWYLEHVPGAFGRLGVGSDEYGQSDLHSTTFTLDERALLVGTRVMTNTALAALSQ